VVLVLVVMVVVVSSPDSSFSVRRLDAFLRPFVVVFDAVDS
jgi:hypothetical protein